MKRSRALTTTSSQADVDFESRHLRSKTRPLYVLSTLCFILILGIVAQQPTSQVGLNRQWADQGKFYSALTAALEHRPNPLVDDGWVGPGYVGVAVALHKVTAIDPEDTLVLLNRLCYLGTVTIVAAFVFFLFRLREHDTRPRAAVGIVADFLYLLCVVHATGLSFVSDIPWSHFVSTFLTVLVFALVLSASHFNNRYLNTMLMLAAGITLGVLFGVRLFDGAVLATALFIPFVVRACRCDNPRAAFKNLMGGAALVSIGVCISFGMCLRASGAKQISLFYLSIKDLNPVMMTLYPSTFPIKFAQIFIDPSFHTAERPLIFRNTLETTWSPSFNDWRMPMMFQSPILVYTLLCVPLFMAGQLWYRRRDTRAEAAVLNGLVIMALTLLVGYTSTFVAGAPHLVFGMIRDYMTTIWCLAIVGAPSAASIWLPQLRAPSRVITAGAAILVTMSAQLAAASGLWPVFESRHIASATVRPQCQGRNCSLSVVFMSDEGHQWREVSDLLLLDMKCGDRAVTVAAVGPKYSFQRPVCESPVAGVVLPRLTGFAGVPSDHIAAALQFRLPSGELPLRGYQQSFDFGLGSSTRALLVSGWSADEHGYVWSSGKTARIEVPYIAAKSERVDMEVVVTPFVAGRQTKQRLRMKVGDGPMQTFVLSKSLETLRISSEVEAGKPLIVWLEMPDAISPFHLGIGADPRPLAVALRSLSLSAQ